MSGWASANGDGAIAAPGPAGEPFNRGTNREVGHRRRAGQSLTSVADDRTGASQLVVISGTLLIVGLGLFALRWTSRRFGG